MLAAAAALLCATPGATAALPQQSGNVDLLNQRYAQWDGPRVDAHAGTGLAGIGDFNGDGIEDFAIGSPGADSSTGETDSGAVYVVYGPAGPGAVDLNTFGSRGLRIEGDTSDRLIGTTVDRAGDVNGDGLDDIVFTPGNAAPASRVAWVVFGRRTTGTVNVGSLGTGGYRVNCAGCQIWTAAGTGDVNDDGRDDLAFGNPIGGGGRVYVLHGKAGSSPVDAAAHAAYEIEGPTAGAGDANATGTSLDGIGDVNGDGRGDLAVGAVGRDHMSREDAGSVFVVFGRPGTTDIAIDSWTTEGYEIGGAQAEDHLGSSVGGGGDVNGDGRLDLVAGAQLADRGGATNAGAAYVVFGKEGNADVDVGGLGAVGFEIEGPVAMFARLGTSSAILGDVTGDGRADVATSAPGVSYNSRAESGSVFVVRGRAGTDPAGVWGPPSFYGYRVDGASAFDQLGLDYNSQHGPDAVAGGDVNGDGRPDLITSSRVAENNGRSESGSAYAVLGFGAPALAYDALLAPVGARVDHRPRAFARTGAASITIDPPLPPELTIDGDTGVISGTATTATADRQHKVTMTDAAGTVATTLRIDIDSAPSGPPPPPPAKSPRCKNTVRGTNRRNTLRGTPLGDKLLGLRGNDKLFGDSGDDCLRGGGGHDRLSAGSGKDTLRGESGNDRLLGSAGNDTIYGGSGKDRANGGLGKDTYTMGSGNDALTTADGVAERVNCGGGRDRVVAADRGDRLRGCERVRRN